MPIRSPFRLLVLSLGALLFAGVLALSVGYFLVAASLPRVDTLSDYRPPIVTRILSEDGKVIAEFCRERRIVVPVSRLPQRLIQAFVAAEDSKFFAHKGIDLFSIGRAAMKNILAGGIVQGGSTITQQVAKSLLLTPEKKFSRKFKEAILAWRIEKSLSKEEILYLYLNQIYLGHGAYGVQAAAENYFAKDVEALTLAECALLAGLPQAPSRYSPYKNLPKARERQKYVLGRMIAEGYITEQEADTAAAQPLTIHPRVNSHIAGAAYFAEQVRRYLETTYGEDLLYTGGLQVRTTMSVPLQEAAQNAVRENLREYDQRHGYRGPVRVLSGAEEEEFLQKQIEAMGSVPPAPGTLVEGVLAGGSAQALEVRIGSFTGRIPAEKSEWAGHVRVVPRGLKAGGNAGGGTTRLPVGSVLLVRVDSDPENGRLLLALEQYPEAQGALLALDPTSGGVKAMVGGFDFYQSQFNRALQARRQPGSAIKPVIYAAALDKGFTPASIMIDTPIVYRDRNAAGEEIEWRPQNYDEKFKGATSLREALTHSYNVVTVKLLEDIGVGYAVSYAQKLGITSPLARDLTLALGSSAITPLELATAYTVFANGGVRLSPVYITQVTDRDGRVLESVDPADFPSGLGKGQRLIRQSAERVISPETAYLITNMMESVVRKGTGQRAQELNRPVAGKTGTTNELNDAWFAGYIPQLVAVAWTGFDQERSLGRGETGAKAALPAWLAFMQEAAKIYPPLDFTVPEGIEFRAIDPATGLLAAENSANAYIEAFSPGTAPSRSVEDVKPRALDFFRLDFEEN